MTKKDAERSLLRQAFSCGSRHRGATKRILRELGSPDDYSADGEAPDFVYVRPRQSKKDRNVVIGIELFQVDHMSEKNRSGGGPFSNTAILRHKARKLFEDNKDAVVGADSIGTGVVAEMAELIGESTMRAKGSSYSAYLDSFEYSLKKHLKKVGTYRENLKRSYGKDRESLIVFLLDVQTDFSGMFLASPGKTIRASAGDLVFFDDVVSLLETGAGVVDYYILCGSRILPSGDLDVVALPGSNVRKNLRKQKRLVYQYAGSDIRLAKYQPMSWSDEPSVSVTECGESFEVALEFNLNMAVGEEPYYSMMAGLKQAWEADRANLPYAADLRVALLMHVYGGYIVGWSDGGENCPEPLMKTLPNGLAEQRYKEFGELWEISG